MGTGVGGGGGGERKSEDSTADTARKRPETVDRRQNNGSVKAVSPRHWLPIDLCTAQLLFQLLCLGSVTKTMFVAPLLRNNLKRKKSNFRSPAPPPCSWSLLGWGSNSTSLLLISPGTLVSKCLLYSHLKSYIAPVENVRLNHLYYVKCTSRVGTRQRKQTRVERVSRVSTSTKTAALCDPCPVGFVTRTNGSTSRYDCYLSENLVRLYRFMAVLNCDPGVAIGRVQWFPN